jgi:hypothetical protein
MDETNRMAVEVADDLTVTIERDGHRVAVRLNAAEARAVAGALAEFAARPRLVSGAADPISTGSSS